MSHEFKVGDTVIFTAVNTHTGWGDKGDIATVTRGYTSYGGIWVLIEGKGEWCTLKDIIAPFTECQYQYDPTQQGDTEDDL